MSTLNDSSRARNFLKSKDTLAYLDLAVADITGAPVHTTFRKLVTLNTSEEGSDNDDEISLPKSSSSSSRKHSKDADEEEVASKIKRKKKKKYSNMFELCLIYVIICLFL